MCGASVVEGFSVAMLDPNNQRRLVRNISQSSCNGLASTATTAPQPAPPAAAGHHHQQQCVLDEPSSWTQDDRILPGYHHRSSWDSDACTTGGGCTSTSGASHTRSGQCCSTDSLQAPHARPNLDGPAPDQQLLLGTSSGVYMLDLSTQQHGLVGLASVQVAHLSYSSSSGLILAACPELEEAMCTSSQQQATTKEAAGLYALNLRHRSSSSSSEASSSSGSVQTTKLWAGNASVCAFAPEQQPAACDAAAAAPASSSSQAAPRIYLGTQPASLAFSDDLGSSWTCCSLGDAPNAEQWYRRLPPYEPSVRSITFAAGGSSSSSGGGGGGVSEAVQVQGQAAACEVLVAVEVGGALTAAVGGSSADAEPATTGWQDIGQGLCKDVHALQRDPFHTTRMYAVCGSGHLPGGLYRCRGQGQKWKRLFGYRYSVGMSLSAHQKGRMLLLSADKAPAIGTNLFESLDGGRCWANITDDVADAAAALTDHEPGLFDHTPLGMYVPGGLVIACVTGHVFHAATKPLGGFGAWKLVAQLPHAITCMCSFDPRVAPVSVSR